MEVQGEIAFDQNLAELGSIPRANGTESVEMGINPFTHGSPCTPRLEDPGLKLDNYGFDAAFGGARRDEEMSRVTSGSSRFAPHSTLGSQAPAPDLLTCTTPAPSERGRIDPRPPVVELDRTRPLADIHLE